MCLHQTLTRDDGAISSVLVALLMIAVAVTSSLITYVWMMGYLDTTMTRAGHAIQIQSVNWNSATAITIYVQNVGEGTITITGAYIDGPLEAVDDQPVNEGFTYKVSLTNLDWSFTNGDEVYIKIVCDDGVFIEGIYTVKGL